MEKKYKGSSEKRQFCDGVEMNYEYHSNLALNKTTRQTNIQIFFAEEYSLWRRELCPSKILLAYVPLEYWFVLVRPFSPSSFPSNIFLLLLRTFHLAFILIK